MRLFTLMERLAQVAKYAADQSALANPEVTLIVNGAAHPMEDVWFMPRQGPEGSICIGDDPR